ncbi:hypothetical protein QR98_0050830 [Sarcoptes scabiei]|uniref:Uncharacterized protein n=1 Tax=Sarcoptes scabiei TaxID=52283 RepID=A0A132A6J9_SARSC|nr:hypothetical protein QR98_0050830 [Sarcoptes scabiei]
MEKSKTSDALRSNSGKYQFLDETSTGTFFLALENVSKEYVGLIKKALKKNTCVSLNMTQLLQIIRILCNKVLEKPTNATVVAKACLEIHHNQQSNVKHLGEHKFRFLESLANCLREWFNERDKLRFTTGDGPPIYFF